MLLTCIMHHKLMVLIFCYKLLSYLNNSVWQWSGIKHLPQHTKVSFSQAAQPLMETEPLWKLKHLTGSSEYSLVKFIAICGWKQKSHKDMKTQK